MLRHLLERNLMDLRLWRKLVQATPDIFILTVINQVPLAVHVSEEVHFGLDIIVQTVPISIQMIRRDIHDDGNVWLKRFEAVNLKTAHFQDPPLMTSFDK